MAALCYIFAESLNDTSCFCLKIEENGAIDAPLEARTFDEIKVLQEGARTIIVLPAITSGIYEVELPWISESKARVALSYALEELLAANVTALHFAFDKAHHQNNKYLVVVIDKEIISSVIENFNAKDISFDEITLDWFALDNNEICFLKENILVNSLERKGSVPIELAKKYIDFSKEEFKKIVFSKLFDEDIEINEPFFMCIAKRLQKKPGINLCQGEFKRTNEKEVFNKKWGMICAVAFGCWLFSILSINLINLWRINHEINLVDQKIEVEYKNFFPNATKVISPKFRISHLLDENISQEPVLWALLDKFNNAISLKEIKVEKITFKNQTLFITIIAPEFAMIESLSNKLKKLNVKVSETDASSKDKNATAVMELRL